MIRSRLPAATALAAILVGYPLLTAAPAAARGETVAFNGGYSAGTIVVRTGQRALYLVLDSGHALRYTVGVGRAGKQWSGTSYINGKYLNPAWSPPADVRRDKPFLPAVIPGGAPQQSDGRRRDDARRAANTPSTAPTSPARSAAWSPTAASACSMRTSPTCSAASAGAPRWW